MVVHCCDGPENWTPPSAITGIPSRFAGKRVHFIGIGGSGMNGLARILLDCGAVVTGSDPNPNAQTRDWSFTPESFTDDDTANPPVEGRVRRTDCGQVTDGAAGIVVVSDRYLADHPDLAARPRAELLGWGHRTVGLPIAAKFAHSADDAYVLPHVRPGQRERRARDAWT